MSLFLDLGTKPAGLKVKTEGTIRSMVNTVFLGDYKISLEDFLVAAAYVLTNTDLEPNDSRLQFVQYVRSMRIIEGYNRGKKRLEASEHGAIRSVVRAARERIKEGGR